MRTGAGRKWVAIMMTVFELVTGVWALLALGMATLVTRDSFRRFH